MSRLLRIVLIALAVTVAAAVPAAAQVPAGALVINEVDYDQVGTDTAEFAEIRNNGEAAVDLEAFTLRFVNGSGGGAEVYDTIDLPAVSLAPGGLFVVCSNAANVPNCDLDDGPDSDFIQNGSPDAVALVQGDTIVDTLSYEGNTADYTEGTGTGTGQAGADSNTVAFIGLSRVPGGLDTGDNAVDFTIRCISPGAPNTLSSSGCTAPPPDGGAGDQAPRVTEVAPPNNASNVPADANVVLTFSEPVDATAAAFELRCNDAVAPTTAQANSEGTQYTLDPTTDLPRGASCTLTVRAAGVSDRDTEDPPDRPASDFTSSFTTHAVEGLRIHDIQGRQHLSPYRGTIVGGVPGIVTARRFNGLYVQDPHPDADERTSEGILIFGTPPAAATIGAAVRITGRVTEFRSGCTPTCTAPDFDAGQFGDSAYANLTTTEMDRATVTVSGTGAIAPTVVGRGGRVPPRTVIDDDTPDPEADDPPLVTGNVEDKSSAPGDTANQDPTFDPSEDGIDFYESLEGMLTRVNRAVVVEPTNSFGAPGAPSENREVAVLADEGKDATIRAPRGPIVARAFDRSLPQEYRRGDFSPERIILNDPVLRDTVPGFPDDPALPANAEVGDRFTTPVDSVVDYSFGNYKFLIRDLEAIQKGALTPEKAPLAKRDELSLASYNVENLDAVNDAERIDAIAVQIRENLRAPDILGLQEVQDNDGEGPTGPNGDASWQAIVAALAEQGVTYEYRQIDPVNNQDGGAPNANIRVGFLFRPDRVDFVDRPGGTSLTGTQDDPAQPGAQLTFSPGRVEPQSPVWEDSRKPLAGEFRYRGRKLFVVVNHLASKGGDAPLFGRFQEPYRPSELQRRKTPDPALGTQLGQAGVLNDWIERLQSAERGVRVVAVGDLNDFQFSETARVVERGEPGSGFEMVDLWRFVPEREQYSYIFQGTAQVLDHILVSPGLLFETSHFDPVHINSEFAEEQQSDHDPPLVRFSFDNRGRGHYGRDWDRDHDR